MTLIGLILAPQMLIWMGTPAEVLPNSTAYFRMYFAGSIAFVMYNTSTNENMQKCAMSINHLEEITGYDFFPELEDELENYLESTYTLKYWGL